MTIDVIILSNTSSIEKYGLTCRAINTLQLSTKQNNIKFNILVVESNKQFLNKGFQYPEHVSVIIPEEDFGYNRFLNHGIKYFRSKNTSSDWVIIANNDVIFTNNWIYNIYKFHLQNPEYLSLSPWEPHWHSERGLDSNIPAHIGYRTSYEITGWCIMMNYTVIDKCDLFDERFKFWYQDNDYALELQKNNIKHALVTSSRVYHDVSGSHDILTNENKYNMTEGQLKILQEKWGV